MIPGKGGHAGQTGHRINRFGGKAKVGLSGQQQVGDIARRALADLDDQIGAARARSASTAGRT
jgi:hypothetical protein